MQEQHHARPPREFGQPTYTLSEIGSFAVAGIGRLTRWAFLCSIFGGIIAMHVAFSIKDKPLVTLTLADVGGEVARWCFSYAIGKLVFEALFLRSDEPPINYTAWAKALPWAVGVVFVAIACLQR